MGRVGIFASCLFDLFCIFLALTLTYSRATVDALFGSVEMGRSNDFVILMNLIRKHQF